MTLQSNFEDPAFNCPQNPYLLIRLGWQLNAKTHYVPQIDNKYVDFLYIW